MEPCCRTSNGKGEGGIRHYSGCDTKAASVGNADSYIQLGKCRTLGGKRKRGSNA